MGVGIHNTVYIVIDYYDYCYYYYLFGILLQELSDTVITVNTAQLYIVHVWTPLARLFLHAYSIKQLYENSWCFIS